MLFSALPSSNAGEAIELRMRAYLLALEGTPAAVLRDAITKILRGDAGLENPRFMPTPPELTSVCKSISKRDRHTLDLLECRAAKGRGEVAFIPSQEQRKKLAAGFAHLSESLGKTIETIGSQRS